MCEIVKALTSASGIRIKAIIALVGELQIFGYSSRWILGVIDSATQTASQPHTI